MVQRNVAVTEPAGRLDARVLESLMYQMLLIRRFEEKAAEMYAAGKIGGFCHLYIGEEAIAVGAISVLRAEDYVIAPYREHGHALARGMSPEAVMAELYGKVGGCSKGKGGSMHLFDRDLRFMGGHAIVGGQLPVAVGLAFAAKYQGEDAITLCFLGDGAVPQGAFHESLNLAALWKLPVVFLIENNMYAMGTPLEKTNAVTDLYKHAVAYGIPGEPVDGMDVLAVREVTERAVASARRGVPVLIEARTYRYRGHSMADPVAGTYRTREELEEQKKRDPILLFRERLFREGVLDDAKLRALDQRVREEVQRAVDFAEASPYPPLEALYEDVYVGPAAGGPRG
ncbi:MAG TPA: pyruvate dehydrogenase (acetyl-transferring) E1 component subunit alpha [Thermodesulfobacteriota bacterium]|nr:pyruvate dehydrogenase (acetyl-transferring) E1 component subunit alpha [Thermodesulfobacteriota bacterium]